MSGQTNGARLGELVIRYVKERDQLQKVLARCRQQGYRPVCFSLGASDEGAVAVWDGIVDRLASCYRSCVSTDHCGVHLVARPEVAQRALLPLLGEDVPAFGPGSVRPGFWLCRIAQGGRIVVRESRSFVDGLCGPSKALVMQAVAEGRLAPFEGLAPQAAANGGAVVRPRFDSCDADLAARQWRLRGGRVVGAGGRGIAARLIMARKLGRALLASERVEMVDANALNLERRNIRLVTGRVEPTPTSGMFKAELARGGKEFHVGTFSSAEEAREAIRERLAELEAAGVV
jgi:hypothetical protein